MTNQIDLRNSLDYNGKVNDTEFMDNLKGIDDFIKVMPNTEIFDRVELVQQPSKEK